MNVNAQSHMQCHVSCNVKMLTISFPVILIPTQPCSIFLFKYWPPFSDFIWSLMLFDSWSALHGDCLRLDNCCSFFDEPLPHFNVHSDKSSPVSLFWSLTFVCWSSSNKLNPHQRPFFSKHVLKLTVLLSPKVLHSIVSANSQLIFDSPVVSNYRHHCTRLNYFFAFTQVYDFNWSKSFKLF